MNRIRFKSEGICCQHLMARLGQEVPGLTAVEKEVLRKQIGAVCDFAGAKLVTYCVMDNHFHVLVEMPGKPANDGVDSRAEAARGTGAEPEGGVIPAATSDPGMPWSRDMPAEPMSRGAKSNESTASEGVAQIPGSRGKPAPTGAMLTDSRIADEVPQMSGSRGEPAPTGGTVPNSRIADEVRQMPGSRDEAAPTGETPRDSGMIDDAEILRRTRAYYAGRTTAHTVAYMALVEAAWEQGGEAWERMRARLMRRMGDISTLMQQLKQRFAIYVNKTRGRRGALWSERFRNVIVEGAATAVGAMAAYIDLNPVRAGLVKDPKDYRFCGYAEAVGGGERARAGIGALTGGTEWEKAGDLYRQLLLGKGRMAKQGAGRMPKGAKERLGLADLVRCRVRYLTDGAVLGSREFVEDWYRRMRMKPPKRLTGARRMKGGDWEGLCVYRDLQKRVLARSEAL